MKKNKLIFAAFLTLSALVACDEGDIIEQDDSVQTSGKIAKLTANITGSESWGNQYSIVLAGFSQESSNAVVQKRLSGADGYGITTLNLTSDDVATIELCVTNRLRERIATFASVPATQLDGDTIRLVAGDVNIGMFKTIQDLVFTGTCARCHGLGATPAGSLTLVEGQSYQQLVEHPARREQNGTRVVPGNAAKSLLHKVIHGDPEAGVSFDHSNMIKEQNTITLIDNWINGGAREE